MPTSPTACRCAAAALRARDSQPALTRRRRQPRSSYPLTPSDVAAPLPPRSQGNIAPAGNFDPANLLEGTSKSEVYRWREAELTHGRVGMLAAAGFLVQEGFHPLFSADGGPAIEQIPALPPAIWFLMTLGIGICETLRIQRGWENPYSGDGQENIQKLKADYYPGDLGFDPLGLKPTDPAELREMQEKELSHGAAPAPPLLPALPPRPRPAARRPPPGPPQGSLRPAPPPQAASACSPPPASWRRRRCRARRGRSRT